MSKIARKLFIGGNWKCNNTLAETKALVSNIVDKIKFDSNKIEVLICPSTVHIQEVAQTLKNKNVYVGAQNISKFDFGAYTGELSAKHLADYNINWTLLGHSERRTLFGEDSKLVAEKTVHALKNKLNVVLCIGETLEERDSSKTLDVVSEQLDAVKTELNDAGQWKNVVIAYEPVWAIGTGKVATPQQAQDVHKFIREWVGKNLGKEHAEGLRVIYGGSVNEKNCKELIQQEDIDGFLIGGAALKQSFKDIVEIVDKA